MAHSYARRWTCPACSRGYLRNVVTVRSDETSPALRAQGYDSKCPKCGHLDLVMPRAAGDLVLAVTYDAVEMAAPANRRGDPGLCDVNGCPIAPIGRIPVPRGGPEARPSPLLKELSLTWKLCGPHSERARDLAETRDGLIDTAKAT